MSDYKLKLGKYGEKITARYLKKNGCKILDKNYYTRYGEIDLVAQLGDEILFIEVKTRTSSAFGYPETAVDYRKTKKLLSTARIYLREKKIDKFWRLDIVSVEIDKDGGDVDIKWFKNITS